MWHFSSLWPPQHCGHKNPPVVYQPAYKQMCRPMGKPTICIGENKGADQLRGNREADQRLCFRYMDSTIPRLPKSEISSFQLFSVLVQFGLCQTCSETTLLVFPRGGSYKTHLSCEIRETCLWVSNQVLHKPACTVIEEG